MMNSLGTTGIYNVKPVTATEKRAGTKYTLFAVHVHSAISGRGWVVRHRYTDVLTFQALVSAHFKLFSEKFQCLEELVSNVKFPRKHKLRSKMGKVIKHRCGAYLE